MIAVGSSAVAQEADGSREVEPSEVKDQITGAVEPLDEGFTRREFLRASGPAMELTRESFTAAKRKMLEGKEERPWLRPFDAWPGLAKFDKKNEKGEVSNTIDWNEFHEYRHQVYHALLKHHDKNKDGKLTGAERDEANQALADNKLLAYLEAECCAGKGASSTGDPIADFKKYLQDWKTTHHLDHDITYESLREMYQSRKQQVLKEDRLVEGVRESVLMPNSQPLTDAELDRILRPGYQQSLAQVMPEEDWKEFRSIIRQHLEWELGAGLRGITAQDDVTDRLMGAPWSAESEQRFETRNDLEFIKLTATGFLFNSSNPAYRIGFPRKPLEVQSEPIRKAGEDVAMDKRFLLTVRTVARVGMPYVHTGAIEFKNVEDRYTMRTYQYYYYPNRRKPYPFDSYTVEFWKELTGAEIVKTLTE